MAKNEQQTEGNETLTDFQQAQLEHMREQTAIWREERAEREERKSRIQARRDQVKRDVEATEKKRTSIRKRCKHLKGGKNNNFAKGQSSDHCVVDNTYPDGKREIICSRCGDLAVMPTRAMRKEMTEAEFKAAQEKWKIWSEFITDNEPSGSQVFLIQEAA